MFTSDSVIMHLPRPRMARTSRRFLSCAGCLAIVPIFARWPAKPIGVLLIPTKVRRCAVQSLQLESMEVLDAGGEDDGRQNSYSLHAASLCSRQASFARVFLCKPRVPPGLSTCKCRV